MIKHYNIAVTGKVQGVWYRKSTLEKASEIGLKGFVQNMPDGSVYIEAEGSKVQLDMLLSWCKKGPEFASVQEVTFQESELKKFEVFKILR